MRATVRLLLVILIIGAGGCSFDSTSSAPSRLQKPAPVQLASFTTRRADGFVLRFRYPASWHAYHWIVGSSFTYAMGYVSTGPEHDPCVSTANSDTCGLPIDKLEPSGVLAWWTAEAFTGENFARLPGRVHRLPSGWFVKLTVATQGTEGSPSAHTTITAITAPSRHSRYLWTLEAKLQGPKIAANTRAVLALLASTRPIRA
jgi:hypothetical protein